MIRTKEEFDEWFNANNGDPWGYQSKSVKERLFKTFTLISATLSKHFSGNIIELGAFTGDFYENFG